MVTQGEYREDGSRFGLILSCEKEASEIVLVSSGNVWSSFKTTGTQEFCYGNTKAKQVFALIQKGIKGCTAKNAMPAPFVKGTVSRHTFKKSKVDYRIDRYNGNLAGAEVIDIEKNIYVSLEYYEGPNIIPEIPYIKMTVEQEFSEGMSEEEAIRTRSLEEISLEKDVTWLRNKKYYIVNDDETADNIISIIENYKGVVSYDTETTGLKMNMFSKVNSKWQKELEEYNAGKPKDEQIRADRLVGVIFCVEKDVSYYFPVFNRKFKNVFEDINSPTRNRIANNIKTYYTIGEGRTLNHDMARYFRDTPIADMTPDTLFMERCRKLLETCNLGAHHGSFEWAVSWCYNIDINLKDDSMILHQLMYKFRSTTSNKGEPSNLKYLTKREFSIDQLELEDFFVGYKEDESGEVRGSKKKKKKKTYIDFSYMDYEGAQAYAPADGDFTLGLIYKYKYDLVTNHPELEYLYQVEVLVACAIGYMEFYGHRLDEEKINRVRDNNRRKMLEIEHQIRALAGASEEAETAAFNELQTLVSKIESLDDEIKALKSSDGNTEALAEKEAERDNLFKAREEKELDCRKAIAESSKEILLSSPAQVARLFYDDDKMAIPCPEDKKSVAKKTLKPLLKMRDEDGKFKYPIVHLYTEWKKLDTLLTKFFDNLQNFMYPGGFIFSSYGQISTATGRMSCSKPNAQQYPKDVTGIVIPRDNYVLFDADFSQIEYRTLVAMAKEEHLAETFKDPDSDYHTLMASLMYSVPYASVTPKMRSDAKSFNFGIPYGMGFKSLAILLTGMSNEAQVEEAKVKYELYFKDQPKVRRFFENVKESALVNKYTQTYFGRRRYYSFTDKDGNASNKRKAMALRQAGNAIIQGCLGEDTRIQTKDYGIMKIKDIVGRRLLVWDGDKWSNGDITYSGKKQKCIVHFSTGQSMVCSPIHKFLVQSSKGNERFVECKDLRGSVSSTNPHRVVINRKYEPSDFKYSSQWAHRFASKTHNANDVFVEDIGDSFKAGIVLGRLASDGSIFDRDVGASSIRQLIAEHEFSIAPKLLEYMQNLNYKYMQNEMRDDRNEKINYINVYSQSLVSEIRELDIKHKIHDNIFMDTELLRGFLRGFFDGDGGISGKAISLVFGTQYDFEPMCRDIQKALLFLGVRSRYRKYDYRHVISISTYDNQKFLDIVGFVNEDKQNKGRQLECVRDGHIFNNTLVVESVEITDEYVDMYDVCNTDGGYYVADGVITHNTAADIFKISVARNFTYIRNNGLLGLVLIINMIHDEQLMEINCNLVNVQRALRDIVSNMEFKISGFPPLYVGAGIGMNWKDAKGKMAEIHPHLAEQLSHEADNVSIWADHPTTPKEILDYFNKRVYEFRYNKVKDYITDPNNFGKDLHPAIGNLINLQFTFGLDKLSEEDKLAGKEQLEGDELTQACVAKFIEVNNLNVDPNMFKAVEQGQETEEDDGYDDDEDELEESEEGAIFGTDFALIDDDDTLYGVSLQDLIGLFGLIVSSERRVCGIDIKIVPYQKKEEMFDYLEAHACEQDDEGAMQVIFLRENNVLYRTQVWVKGIDGSAMSTKLRLNAIAYR